MIEVRGLGHRFGLVKVALDEVSFDVPEGSVCAVLGRNGSGKTTLLRILAGVLPPPWGGRLGRVSVCGFDPDDSTLDIRRVSGFLPAAGPVTLVQRVHDLLDLYVGLEPHLSRDLFAYALSQAGVDLNAKLRRLSRGELRRVLSTLVLVRDPKALFLDEPTDGLDPEAAEALLDRIRDRAGRSDRCTLVATHRPEDVERCCDRVALLRDGRVLLEGDLDSMKDSWARLAVRFPRSWKSAGTAAEPLAVMQWEDVVAVDDRAEGWEVTVLDNAEAIAARLEEHGATDIDTIPVSFRELYLSAMGQARELAPGPHESPV